MQPILRIDSHIRIRSGTATDSWGTVLCLTFPGITAIIRIVLTTDPGTTDTWDTGIIFRVISLMALGWEIPGDGDVPEVVARRRARSSSSRG